jgi:hypothetical protein
VWWEDTLNTDTPVGLPWASIFGFVRLVTHPSAMVHPLSALDALGYVDRWLERPDARIVDPGPRHMSIVRSLFGATAVAANLTTDTHLAALAIEYQAELCSNDTDFSRFPGLRWSNPLAAA